MQESTLHALLKEFYTQDGGSCEVWVDGYLIDVVKGDQLIEIQTGNFSLIKNKLAALIDQHPIMVVHPIAKEKIIITRDKDNLPVARRRSPKQGRVEHLFDQLVYISQFAAHPNFSLEVILTGEEEERVADGQGSWKRRGKSIEDHRLVSIFQRFQFNKSADYLALLPVELEQQFSNKELSNQLSIPIRLAARMTYCLTKMGVLAKTGQRGRTFLFQRLV